MPFSTSPERCLGAIKALFDYRRRQVEAPAPRPPGDLAAARQRVRDFHGEAYDRGVAAARATDEYVRENAWPVIAGAAALGFLIGFLVRGDSDD
jgi:ElaB/YqjD/DUF883 family membrane-anchored ribosome-binding protein